MKVDKVIANLICDLEYQIGSECYNPNSYDGWTGDEGCEFRYPVYIRVNKNDTELKKFRSNISHWYKNVDEYSIETMKYKFGSNHLFIGNGIRNVLEELEKRYGLNFNQLESERLANTSFQHQ